LPSCLFQVHVSFRLQTIPDSKLLNAILPSRRATEPTDYTASDIAILDELAELGLQIARCSLQQAIQRSNPERRSARCASQPTTTPQALRTNASQLSDPILAFARVSRAAQTSIAPKHRLIGGQAPSFEAPAFEAPAFEAPAFDSKHDEAQAESRRPDMAEYLLPNEPYQRRALHRDVDDIPGPDPP